MDLWTVLLSNKYIHLELHLRCNHQRGLHLLHRLPQSWWSGIESNPDKQRVGVHSTCMYNLWHCWRRWSAPSPVATNVPCKSCQRWCFFLVTYLHGQMDVAGVCLLLGYYARPKPVRKKTILSEVGNFATICQSPCVCFPADHAATKQGQARLIWEQ